MSLKIIILHVYSVTVIKISLYKAVTHTVQYIQYNTYSTIHTVQYIQYNTYSTIHTIQYILYLCEIIYYLKILGKHDIEGCKLKFKSLIVDIQALTVPEL